MVGRSAAFSVILQILVLICVLLHKSAATDFEPFSVPPCLRGERAPFGLSADLCAKSAVRGFLSSLQSSLLCRQAAYWWHACSNGKPFRHHHADCCSRCLHQRLFRARPGHRKPAGTGGRSHPLSRSRTFFRLGTR